MTTIETPQFVRWAIEQACPLRDHACWRDPERTEKQLKSLRAYSQAVEEGRFFEGYCFETTSDQTLFDITKLKGFRAVEILDAYGGESLVKSLCGDCPANATSIDAGPAFAGCYGWFDWSICGSQFHDEVNCVVNDTRFQSFMHHSFLATHPRWYGLWADSPQNSQQRRLMLQIMTKLVSRLPVVSQPMLTYMEALKLSLANDLPIHATFVPRGQADEVSWTLVAHCCRCKADMADDQRSCSVCGRVGRPSPAKKRNVRGSRPYRELTRQLGRENVSRLWQRYRQVRTGDRVRDHM